MKKAIHRLLELRELAESKGETLYNICFRNAGVGFMWFDQKKAGAGSYKKGLYVDKYYDTIEEATVEETKRFKQVSE